MLSEHLKADLGQFMHGAQCKSNYKCRTINVFNSISAWKLISFQVVNGEEKDYIFVNCNLRLINIINLIAIKCSANNITDFF